MLIAKSEDEKCNLDKRKGPVKVKTEKDRTKDSRDLQAKDKADVSETLEKVQVKEEKSREEKVEVDTISENLDHAKDKGDILTFSCKTSYSLRRCMCKSIGPQK